ncbi:MAG: efflux RND transporter permease subunit [Sandaracinaceae bacterium]|nr:efflux RND transporter permease subunit [Sandaracinaceae bacterium]
MLLVAGFRVAPFELFDVEGVSRDPVPVDAIPDVGENQQIVFTEWAGRSPRDVEDQITYPLTTALLGIPGVRTVRSASAFGFSTVYVIFDDSVDFYWSRSRVLEKLASLAPGLLPDGVSPTLGPDATALGQVFWYTLEGHDPDGNVVGGWDLHELRSIQDWTVRYALQSVDGVSEVSSVGGYVREYQVDVDPDAMRAHGVTLAQVAGAVRESNLDVGARTLEINRVEYLVRGVGFLQDLGDLEEVVVAERDHTPIRVRDVAHVHQGPALRRGGLDDAGAEVVGGVVVARYRNNPLQVIDGVHARIAEIAPGLPRRELADGTISQVTIVPFYDRSQLIHETIGTLSTALWQEILITVIVVLVMLRDLRSSLLITSILPLGVLLALVVMRYAGVDANIMALGGIAIAIGTMVDMGIVFTENIVQHLDEAPADADRAAVVKVAAAEVAPAVLTSVATTVVSFLPVFGLTAAEARLFTPLAFTKTFAMGGALLLAMLVIPAMAHVVLRRRPAPRGDGEPWNLARVGRSVARVEHLRDWLMVVAGAALVTWNPWAGGFVALLGVTRLARPMLPKRIATWIERTESWVAIAGVTIALAADWLPLGPAEGLVLNALFVGLVVTLVLGTFRLFEHLYPLILRWCLRHKAAFLALPALIVVGGALAWLGFDGVFGWLPPSVGASTPARKLAQTLPGLGREYMPPFDEGAYLYMPTTMPHASVGEVREAIAAMDAAIAEVPEVDRVVGKWGRADSALDPAPVSMVETIITYRPEYRTEADGTRVRQWRDHIRTPRDIWDEIVAVAQRPGMTSAPVLMPIAARIVMLQSGMRAPMGIKVQGPDLETIERFGLRLEELLRQVPQIRAETVFADRVVGKPYVEVDIDREAIARYGLTIEGVQHVLQIALGGMPLTRTVEGRERYPVRVRYMREERDSVEALGRVMVPTSDGEQIPLGQLAELRYVRGPQMIRSEDTFLTSYVLFDRQPDVAEVNAVEAAQRFLQEQIDSGALEIPAGVRYTFAGTYEAQLRSEARMAYLIPLALALVFILLYLQFRRLGTALIIYSGVAVAVSGGFILLWLYAQPWFLDFDVLGTSMRDLFQVSTVNLSMAVWVGVIALIGVATDDGVVLSTYLKQRFEGGAAPDVDAVRARVLEAGMRRVRPCLMTTATTILALIPVITSQGRGADVMVPMALPSVGGMTIELITLFVVPVLYCWVEEQRTRFAGPRTEHDDV